MCDTEVDASHNLNLNNFSSTILLSNIFCLNVLHIAYNKKCKKGVQMYKDFKTCRCHHVSDNLQSSKKQHVIKISAFKCILFLYVCYYLFQLLSISTIIIKNVFKLKFLLPTCQQNDKLESQSFSQNCLMCFIRAALLQFKRSDETCQEFFYSVSQHNPLNN